MIIYLLTFYLFDDIDKKFRITYANHSATSNGILTKMHMQPERLYFQLRFALGINHGDRATAKHQKNNYYIHVKPLFSAVEFRSNVTF